MYKKQRQVGKLLTVYEVLMWREEKNQVEEGSSQHFKDKKADPSRRYIS